MRILFQGDSITDAGRDKEAKEPNIGLGSGYVNMIYEKLRQTNSDIQVLNRGVYGNKITDMYARWREDTLNINYDILSVLCGINDIGFERRLNIGNDIEKYGFVYDRMLYEAKKFNPNAKIVLIAPFLFKVYYKDDLGGYDIYNDWKLWSTDIETEGKTVKKLAQKYDAVFVPAFDKFKEKCAKNGWDEYSSDGIHLNEVGAKVLADLWVDTIFAT